MKATIKQAAKEAQVQDLRKFCQPTQTTHDLAVARKLSVKSKKRRL